MNSKKLSGVNNAKHEFSFVEEHISKSTRRFTLKGRVTVNEASVMEFKMNESIKSGCERIIINMSLVSMFTSAGIRVILSTHKKLKKAGGELKIENPAENVRNVIGMAALDEMLL